MVGDSVGNSVGDLVGASVETSVGDLVGDSVGDSVGESVGELDGDPEGSNMYGGGGGREGMEKSRGGCCTARDAKVYGMGAGGKRDMQSWRGWIDSTGR